MTLQEDKARDPLRGPKHPLVSVITPTYNRAALLPRAIASVLSQDFTDLELIVIDDGSTDDTPQVVAGINDPRVQYVRLLQNRGIGSARNEAVCRAKGELVAFIDSDDVWLPGKLAYQVELMHRYPHFDVLFADYQNINLMTCVSEPGFRQNEHTFRQLRIKQVESEVWEIVDGLPQAMLIANPIGTCSMVMMRRRVFDTIGNFDTSLSGPEDAELWWRAAVRGATFAFSVRRVIQRHKDRDSITAKTLAFGLSRIRMLDSCEAVAAAAGRHDLKWHTDRAKHITLRGLVRDHALLGQRRAAIRAFVASLRYGISARACFYLAAALVGPSSSKFVRRLGQKVFVRSRIPTRSPGANLRLGSSASDKLHFALTPQTEPRHLPGASTVRPEPGEGEKPDVGVNEGRLRVVYCSYHYHPPDFGGATIREARTLARLCELGDQVTVYTSGRPSFLRRTVTNGAACRRSPCVGKSRTCRAIRRILFSFWLLAGLAAMRRPDVVFLGVLSPLTGLAASLCCRFRRIRTVSALTLIGETDPLGLSNLPLLSRTAMRAQLRFTSGIVTISNALYEAACSRVGKHKVRLIYNGTLSDVFRPSPKPERTKLRGEHGVENGTVVFSFLGSLTERKGFDVLLAAFDQVAHTDATCRLWVIGPRNRSENHNMDDTQVASFLRRSKHLKRVQLFGRIDDPHRVAAILSASDVFIFPSRREGFGNVIIEAMSCEVPVLVNRLPGVTDIAPLDGETGFFFEGCDAAQLSELMMRLVRDPALRARLGAKARERVLQSFSFDQYVHQWRTAFLDLRLHGFSGSQSEKHTA